MNSRQNISVDHTNCSGTLPNFFSVLESMSTDVETISYWYDLVSVIYIRKVIFDSLISAHIWRVMFSYMCILRQKLAADILIKWRFL